MNRTESNLIVQEYQPGNCAFLAFPRGQGRQVRLSKPVPLSCFLSFFWWKKVHSQSSLGNQENITINMKMIHLPEINKLSPIHIYCSMMEIDQKQSFLYKQHLTFSANNFLRDATQSPGKSAIFSSPKIVVPPPSPFYLQSEFPNRPMLGYCKILFDRNGSIINKDF